MTWDGVFRLFGDSLDGLAARHGGLVTRGGAETPERLVAVDAAGPRDLAPLLTRRFLPSARAAAARGASLLVDVSLVRDIPWAHAVWSHDHAAWAMSGLLDRIAVPDEPASVGPGCVIATTVFLGPRVVLGARVTIGPGAVIGHPGFGWALGPDGVSRGIPQLAGVRIEDDVAVGPLCTVDAGTLQATRIRRGAKLDAQVHVGHNVDIGEDTFVAAQCGFAGSVRVGRSVLVGGQAGFADHVVVGDGARIAAKSGVIGDVPAGAIVAGYPAVPRARWLRALATMYRRLGDTGESRDDDRD